ncbi:MAG: ATP-binding cassette domain-containing protein [Mangrovicoccus sp.]|nr:ATP-binding cassette domain-containing protein [Mangrovicoccus sp.]
MIEIQVTLTQGAFSLNTRFDLEAQGITGLTGRSGSGKSTLCACIAGHLRPDQGRIVFNDRVLFDSAAKVNLPPAKRRIGLVFQDGALFPHRSVQRNLTYGAKPGREKLFTEIVQMLDLAPLLRARPRNLSGGERQRVAIGRALMAEPELLLLDEPVSALDPGLRARTLDLIERVQMRTGTPMIFISHSPQEVNRLCAREVILTRGEVSKITKIDRSKPYLHLAHTEDQKWAV